MIQLQDVRLMRGSHTLFDSANITLHTGWKTGIIGQNGTGKTSLFKLLLGELHSDLGDCTFPKQWQVAHMQQHIDDLNRPVIEWVIDGDHELRQLQSTIDKLSDSNVQQEQTQLAQAHARLEEIGGYQANAKAAKLLNGLGFKEADIYRPIGEFSGGWQVRANLAQALMCRSDLLLLDEPTNHLDLDAIIWFEQWLKQYPGTLLLISHDREFLDGTVNHIVEIDQQQLTLYTGNYEQFEQQKSERLAQQQANYVKQQETIQHLESFINRFKAKASKAKQAQSRIKVLEKMEMIAPAHIDSPFRFRFSEPEKQADPLINLNQLDLGYEQTPILQQVKFAVSPGDRIGLIGPNGAGKSTLIKSIADQITPLKGDVWHYEYLALGYFSQNQLDQLDLKANAITHIQRLSPKVSEQIIRDFLGGFNFRGDKALQQVEHFSGGERCRLALAMIVWQKPNLLLLDEPTNHLDIDMRDALCMALQDFDGALILVSHDRHLLKATTDQLYLVANGSVAPYDGDLDDYASWLKQQKANSAEAPQAGKEKVDKKAQRQQEAAIRQALAPLKKNIQKIEKQLEKLQAEQEQLQEQLADTDLYSDARKDDLKAIMAKVTVNKQSLEENEMQWLELNEELEGKEQALREIE